MPSTHHGRGRRTLRGAQVVSAAAIIGAGLFLALGDSPQVEVRAMLHHGEPRLVDRPCERGDWAQWDFARLTSRGTPVELKVCFPLADPSQQNAVRLVADAPPLPGELVLQVLHLSEPADLAEIEQVVRATALPPAVEQRADELRVHRLLVFGVGSVAAAGAAAAVLSLLALLLGRIGRGSVSRRGSRQ